MYWICVLPDLSAIQLTSAFESMKIEPVYTHNYADIAYNYAELLRP